MVKSDKKSFQSVYVKILMNHLQLVVIISIFSLDWPNMVLNFFYNISPLSNPASQIFSFDCFLDTRGIYLFYI